MVDDIILTALFLAFIIMGCFGCYSVAIKPILNTRKARKWVKVPCTIETSELKCEVGGDGPGYRPEIRYVYEYNNKSYKSDRFSFFVLSTSLKKRYQRIVESYYLGMRSTCYVNPSNPTEAVLVVDDKINKIATIMSILFTIIGLSGLTYKLAKLFSD